MATGTGKTTVMGMIAAWSILNKVADRGDARFSDVVLVVCPNVTVRNRLEELKPQGGEASLYRSRDLVPSHLVKIPQLAVRDTSGAPIPGYFNIWRWILPKLTPAERGGRHGRVKPETVLKYAHVPMAMLGGLWDVLREEWSRREAESRPPVFIIVCNDTVLAKVVYRWLAEDKAPAGVPPARLDGLRNVDGAAPRTIRVDTRVVRESDGGEAKSDRDRWMRLTLDTVGRVDWPRDGQGRPIRPEGFEALARKLERPLHPPGRDVRCIVSVGMLTEGWDCNTVTHIVGLRPFMSQLLCEQVVGRGLRRSSYAVGEDGKLGEEVAKIFGVPFEIVPLKENPPGSEARPPPKTWRVRAVPGKAHLEIRFPRVEGYTREIRHRLMVDWESIAPLRLDPMHIPPEVEMKAGLPGNTGRPSLVGPGRIERVDLNPYRKGRRLQRLVFEMARDLTRDYRRQPGCDAPAHALFPQLAAIVERYVREKVRPVEPARRVDAFLSPWYGWLVERLVAAIGPDHETGKDAELPRYESGRGPGSTAEGRFRDTARALPRPQEPRQRGRARHRQMGAIGCLPPGHARAGALVRQERRPRFRDPLPAQRPAPRVPARFHRTLGRRRSALPDPGDQGLRPAHGGEVTGGRAVGAGRERGRGVRGLGLCGGFGGGEGGAGGQAGGRVGKKLNTSRVVPTILPAQPPAK